MMMPIILLPLIIGILGIIIIKNERFAQYAALLSIIGSSIIGFYLILYNRGIIENYKWFNLIRYSFSISFTTSTLNVIMLGLISIIAPIIFIYSLGYMQKERNQRRFYIQMLIFTAAMIIFSIAGNLVTMFIAWGFLGITSYMLIGFWQESDQAQEAARVSITTILIGDVLFLAAIIMIFVNFGTTDIRGLIATPYKTQLYLPMILIMIAAFTKSAQFPFNEWLADAMQAPTPVSAFLHSSTMVKAGVFMILVLMPIYVSLGINSLFLVVGCITAVIAITNALSEHKIKRILAYSTMEDLALMFIAIGLNSIIAAIMLFVVQTFYKALLFMNAGGIMRANSNNEDIYKSYGLSSNKFLLITSIIGVISLAGIIPFGTFFAKTLLESTSTNAFVYAFLLIINIFSSVYIFRWIFIPLRKGKPSKKRIVSYRTIPLGMKIGIAITTLLVMISPLLILYSQKLGFGLIQMPSMINYILDIIVGLIGLLIAYLVVIRGILNIDINSRAWRVMHNSYFINKAYALIAHLVLRFGDIMNELDYSLFQTFRSSGVYVYKFGNKLKYIVDGNVNNYMIILIVGISLLLLTLSFMVFGVL